jgi:hypothetical protein
MELTLAITSNMREEVKPQHWVYGYVNNIVVIYLVKGVSRAIEVT